MIAPQIVTAGDSARTRFTDPVTSHEAADSNTDLVKMSRTFVANLLDLSGPLADHELVEKAEAAYRAWPDAPHWTPQRLRTARHELTELGVVEDTGIYRLTPSNRRAKVWAVVAS